MTDLNAIAEAIAVLRRRAGLKQKELADKARVSYAHMSRIERAKVEAKRPTLQRIAGALGLTLAKFYHFVEELSRSQAPEAAQHFSYPANDASPRRQPEAIAEERRRVEYFFQLDDDEPES